MDHQKPAARVGLRRVTQLRGSDAADLVGVGFDQPLGLLGKRRQ
jgi:hypothetical protein